MPYVAPDLRIRRARAWAVRRLFEVSSVPAQESKTAIQTANRVYQVRLRGLLAGMYGLDA